ncbi:hypothetical protein ACOSQ3_004666 [Xanthoceras sorbifolium]
MEVPLAVEITSNKIHIFSWSLLHEKILINNQRVVRGLAIDDFCPRCGVSVEDLDHLLCGCIVSVNIWEQLYRGCTNTVNFSCDFDVWLCSNLKDNRSRCDGIPNFLLFAVILWYIWKWKCNVVFNTDFQVPLRPHIPFSNMVWTGGKLLKVRRIMRFLLVSLLDPSFTWVDQG